MGVGVVSRQVVEFGSRLFVSSIGVDADAPADGKSTARRRLEHPPTGFPQRPPRFLFVYAIAIKSSWSPAVTSGVRSRRMDSALK